MKSFDPASILSLPQLDSYISLVQKDLESVIDVDNDAIRLPLQRIIKARSKRIRPIFVLAVAKSQNVKITQKVINACTAIELTHIGSLVHDDIIDEASTRWKIPTINSQEGIGHAIVIGDFLFANSFRKAARVDIEAGDLIGKTLAALCDGQSREQVDIFNHERTFEALKQVQYGKTAALFEASCKIGGICSGSSVEQIKSFAQFGKNFGMAFQLIDDLMDLISSDKLIGKPVGNDMIEGVYTLPILDSLQSGSSKKLFTLLKKTNIPKDKVVEILFEEGSIEKSIQEIQKYNELCAKSLKDVGDNKIIDKLKSFPSEYMTWALSNLVEAKHYLRISKFLAKN